MKKYILFLFVFTLLNINVSFANATDVPVSNCTIGITLRVGSRGEQVKCLQASLGGLIADGNFGQKTKAAVVAFQRNNNLVPDGIFGIKSRAAWVAQGWGNPQSSVVISGVSGPQSLNINQEGTWTVTASEKNGGNLSYFVVWGDEAQPVQMTSPSGLPMQQSATFTHSYSISSTYAPRFIVTNNIVCVRYPCPSSSASTSLSVKVDTIYGENPIVSSLSSSSGVIGSQVTIYGAGFAATGNKIKFGDSNSENDPAYSLNSNGNSITFAVPSSYYVACLHSSPACMIATRMIQPGIYPVSVISANGTSNSVNFTVTSY